MLMCLILLQVFMATSGMTSSDETAYENLMKIPEVNDISLNFPSVLKNKHEYDDSTYGKEWMYFPDGDGIPRRISLTLSPVILRRANIDYTDDIEYRLYTSDDGINYINLDESANLYNESEENNTKIIEKLSTLPIKLITHGWKSSADQDAVINIKDAYLKAQDVNVITVNWRSTADNIVYPIVAVQTQDIGSRVGHFLDSLGERYNISGSRVHLIGHSLGAHVMGNAGKVTGLKINRITGLDPARPLFEFPERSNSVKLDPSDADFVDVIHTCGGVLGVENTIGHADFYPNSGTAPQPGCWQIPYLAEACSHGRSHLYYAESVLFPTAFPACSSMENEISECVNFMGESVNYNATGKFYLLTNNVSPFGTGHPLNKKNK